MTKQHPDGTVPVPGTLRPPTRAMLDAHVHVVRLRTAVLDATGAR